MKAFYNDTEPYAAQWLRNLSLVGEISEGDVIETPIQEIEPWQLAGYTRHHFFAGLGGWDYALKLAGWPDDLPVWTGSCPCQPFSVAGKRKGVNDERHLWPYFRNLIEQRRPAIIFGEQVASKDGRVWLAGVRSDLEALGYAVGAADLCASGIGAPHIRQRLYWLAVAGCDERWRLVQHTREGNGAPLGASTDTSGSGTASGLDNTADARRSRNGFSGSSSEARNETWLQESSGRGSFSRLGDDDAGLERRRLQPRERTDQFTAWTPSAFIQCLDGKARRVEPGIFPLAHGVSARVGKLRAYGNAIVPQVAAEFIRSAMDILL